MTSGWWKDSSIPSPCLAPPLRKLCRGGGENYGCIRPQMCTTAGIACMSAALQRGPAQARHPLTQFLTTHPILRDEMLRYSMSQHPCMA